MSPQFQPGGQMQMGRGAAYLLNQNLEAIPVTKELWQTDGRTFLIESVPFTKVQPLLETLQASVSKQNKDAVALRVLPDRKKLVALDGMKPKQESKEVASIKPSQSSPHQELVWDYSSINTSQTNYSFKGDATYFISANFGLFGTNTVFEGGTVIKYTNNVSLTANTPITWQATPFDFHGRVLRPNCSAEKTSSNVADNLKPSWTN